MSTHADKAREDRSNAAANNKSESRRNGGAAFEFVDNRPSALAQRKLQAAMNRGPQGQGWVQLQAMIDKSPHQVAQRKQLERFSGLTAERQVGLGEDKLQMSAEPAVAQRQRMEDTEQPQGKVEPASQNIIQRHPLHWQEHYNDDLDELRQLPSGSAKLGKTKLGRIQANIDRYGNTPTSNYARRKELLTKIETDINARNRKTDYSETSGDKAYPYLQRVLELIQYEREEMVLSEKRDEGLLDPDDPTSWQQSKSFPVTEEYEITFRGLTKLKLGSAGVKEPKKLGEMSEIDKRGFEQARPNDVLRYADTGPNISLSRSFDFADKVSGTKPGKGKSNLIVVQIVRPGYGIDVEQNAYNEEEAGVEGITELNKQKAREAKEIATLRNPLELIIGWVEIRQTDLKGTTVVVPYAKNPAFKVPKKTKLTKMKNYGEYRKLLGKYSQ